MMSGLIPARAGNTLHRGCPNSRTWAHPRSRGEHGFRDDGKPHVEGSSPLARGTPPERTFNFSLTGLIPARAGNTERFMERCHDVGAHPRSRGEHITPGLSE